MFDNARRCRVLAGWLAAGIYIHCTHWPDGGLAPCTSRLGQYLAPCTSRPHQPPPCTTPSPSPCHRSTSEHNIRGAQQNTSPPTAKTIPSVLPGLPANHILSFLAGNWCYQIKEMTKPQKTAESDRFGPDKEEELVFSFDLTIHCSRDEEKYPQGARLSNPH